MSENIVFQHKWMMIREDRYGTPFVDMTPSDGTMVVALNARNEVVILSEFSPAYDRPIYYLPGGAIDPGESAADSANRELQEEAGFKAARLDDLGTIHPFMKYMQACFHVFLARDLSPNKLQGDETTEIIVKPLPFADFESWIADGHLQDSSVIAALYRARSFLESEAKA
jgi:8-oxo-dGTP pyrophosphatase MutT (NUDIX family)